MAYDGYLNQLRAKNYANYRKFNSTDITLNGPNSFTCLSDGNKCAPPSITLNSPAERLPVYPNPNHIQFNGETSFTVLSPPTKMDPHFQKRPHFGKIMPVLGNKSGEVYNIGEVMLEPGTYHIYFTISFQLLCNMHLVRVMYGINNEADFDETAPNDLPYSMGLVEGVCLNYTGSQLIHLQRPESVFLNGGLFFDSRSEYKIDGTLVAVPA